jgi:hypothetical protein
MRNVGDFWLSSTDRAGVRAMNHAQKYLAQANRQIAELAVQVASQRVIVKHALDTGQRSEMAESLLDALEGSLSLFEKHRIFLLTCIGSFSALPAGDAATGRSWSRRNGHGAS